jgi:hypothetical protein
VFGGGGVGGCVFFPWGGCVCECAGGGRGRGNGRCACVARVEVRSFGWGVSLLVTLLKPSCFWSNMSVLLRH